MKCACHDKGQLLQIDIASAASLQNYGDQVSREKKFGPVNRDVTDIWSQRLRHWTQGLILSQPCSARAGSVNCSGLVVSFEKKVSNYWLLLGIFPHF